jgi:hypothetical protein
LPEQQTQARALTPTSEPAGAPERTKTPTSITLRHLPLPKHRGTRNRSLTNLPHKTHVLNAVLNKDTGKLEEYRHLIKGKQAQQWRTGNVREIARLAQGLPSHGIPTGTDSINFLHPRNLPANRTATYLRVVSDYRPQKADPYRIRWTVGGNRIHYPGDTYTPCADITTNKCLFNSVILTPGAKFMTLDIKDYYLNTEMQRKEYMMVHRSMIPEEIITAYNLHDKFDKNDMILVEIAKGMYGLPQAGRLAYDKLIKILQAKGF